MSAEAEILEKKLIHEYFKNASQGFFIEVGANDPKELSQTWQLEQAGWKGILVEPLSRFYDQLVAQRPNSQVVKAACSSEDKVGKATLFISPNMLGCSTLEKNIDDIDVEYPESEIVSIITLNSILEKAKPKHIQLLSIDVEGTELDVLKGCNLSKYKPDLILIEDKLHSLEKHRYLIKHGYKLVKRTGLNNWYIPKEHSFYMTDFIEKLKLYRKVFIGMPARKFRRLTRKFRCWKNGRLKNTH